MDLAELHARVKVVGPADTSDPKGFLAALAEELDAIRKDLREQAPPVDSV